MEVWRVLVLTLQIFSVCVTCKFSPDKDRERNKLRTKPKQPLKYKDCGSNPDRPLKILYVGARPLPLRAPGNLRLSFSVNVTHALPESVSMDVSIVKFFYGFPFKIPCYKNFGTCHYKDICAHLTPWDRAGCPRVLERHKVPCSCPFQPGLYTLPRLKIPIPRMDGVLEMLAKGDYEATVRLYDPHTKVEYGCLELEFSMKKRRRKKKTHWMGVT